MILKERLDKTMQKLFRQIKRIIYVAYIGIQSKPEKTFIPRESNLNNKSYEPKKVIYRAHPINHEFDSK